MFISLFDLLLNFKNKNVISGDNESIVARKIQTFFVLILIQEEVTPKRYNLCSPRWTLVSWKEEDISGIGTDDGVEGICGSWKNEGYLVCSQENLTFTNHF